MPPSEAEKIFRAFAGERKRALPQFTPDGIPITLENKFDDAIYNYLYEYWKTNSGEYDPKDDEIIMTKESSFTKNEKKFEQWLLQQYGMTKKEEREYTFKGNLLSLGEIGLSAWGIEGAGATKLVVPGKFLASNADDTAKNVAKQEASEVVEDVIENTAKKVIWTGKDKYVPELANVIEEKFPGKIKAVERLLYDSDGRLVTDLDIELDDIIIQVKSGSAKGLTTQMLNTFNATGKVVISYTPDIKQSSSVLKGVRAKGFNTFTTMDELLKFLNDYYK